MSPAAEAIRAEISVAGGEIPFERFMELALYGDGGYYSTETQHRAGRRGDFITSPEVGPLFGAVLSRALDRWWTEAGEPDDFVFVDAGAGPGTLARAILAASPRCADALRYVAVEVATVHHRSHPEGIESVAAMPAGLGAGVVFANELLDNLPFELWVHDGRWRTAHVATDGDRFVEVLRDGPVPAFLPDVAPHGTRVPVQSRAASWLAGALSGIRAGRVVVVDYCWARTGDFVGRPWREWLRTYSGHERAGHYLAAPGVCDITAQVAIDQLAAVREPDAVRSQSQFLDLWGIGDLVEEGRAYWSAHASAPNLEAMLMRSRISEAEALRDPAGLGAHTVIEWSVDP